MKLLILLMIMPWATALSYNATQSCTSCLMGEQEYWNITVYNQGQNYLEILRIDIIANQTILITQHNQSKTVFTREEFQIPGKLPVMNQTVNMTYNVCFMTSVPPEQRLVEDVYVGTTMYFCQKENHTIRLLQCNHSQNCRENQACIQNNCQSISCECGHIQNHTCIKYSCCSDYQCGANQNCTSHNCTNIECPGQILNHTCSNQECPNDTYLQNNTCTKLQCEPNQAFENHTCITLKCREDEKAEEHACKKLQCADNQTYSRHKCTDLECLANQSASNHTCTPKKCKIAHTLQTDGTCKLNTNYAYLGAEPFALVAIAAAAFLIARKYKNRQRTKKT